MEEAARNRPDLDWHLPAPTNKRLALSLVPSETHFPFGPRESTVSGRLGVFSSARAPSQTSWRVRARRQAPNER
jgi:hypothetical protein